HRAVQCVEQCATHLQRERVARARLVQHEHACTPVEPVFDVDRRRAHSSQFGSVSVSEGAAYSSARQAKSPTGNGTTPRKIRAVPTRSPTTALITNTFIPTGGVMRLISSSLASRMPIQTMS